MGRTGAQALQFLAGLALARILAPADFGLLASVYVITGFTVLLFDMGLSAALVHQREVRQADYDTAFWLNALGGLVFIGVLAALGPFVADFYGDDRLTWITPLAGLGFALALNVSHAALLQRSMQFKKVAAIELSCAVLANAATLIGALSGMGAFALVLGPAVQGLAGTIITWTLVRWRPRGFISRPSVRRLWSFSGGMLGFSVVNYAGRNSDNLLIGRLLGATALGYYNRAYTLMLLPLQQISQVLGRVMFPALAAMQGDRERLQGAYRRVILVMTAVIMPVLVGMAAVADGLVPCCGVISGCSPSRCSRSSASRVSRSASATVRAGFTSRKDVPRRCSGWGSSAPSSRSSPSSSGCGGVLLVWQSHCSRNSGCGNPWAFTSPAPRSG